MNGTEGVSVSGEVAIFSEVASRLTAPSVTAAINWGDGSTSNGAVTSNGSGGFNVSGNHIYAEEGPYAVIVTVSTGGQNGSSAGSASVADAPLTASGFRLIVKGRLVFAGQVASFHDAYPNGVVRDF